MAFFFFFCLNKLSNYKILFYFSFLDTLRRLKFYDLVVSFNWINFFFFLILLIISGSVGLFSIVYMKNDYFYNRFFFLFNLFIFSMIILLVIPHYVFFLIGWDGLGFSRFLLISYYKSSRSWSSRLKTFLINRFGDRLILASAGYYLYQGHFWFFFQKIVKYLFILLVVGLLTKSAHIPFSRWLPAAMAAPTPVSALVHSSTLVTAGLFIIIQLIFYLNKRTSCLLVILGVFTIFFGCLNALFNFDSKKVVAYSTLSKLGLMGVSLGCGLVGLSLFHLLMHGVSKALLFIRIGQIMLKESHNQDLRKFSLNFWKNFLSLISMMWRIFSLMGIFFLSCYYSKDIILENFYRILFMNYSLFMMLLFSFFLTFIYSLRLINFFLVFKKLKKKKFFCSSFITIIFFSSFFLFFSTLILGLFQRKQILYYQDSFGILKIIVYLCFFFSFFYHFIFLKPQNLFIKFFHYFNSSWLYFINNKFVNYLKNLESGILNIPSLLHFYNNTSIKISNWFKNYFYYKRLFSRFFFFFFSFFFFFFVYLF